MKKLNYILGLDIGVNSIGWAVVECKTEKDEPHKLVALNSRVFQEKAERDTEVPKNIQRRAHRNMRRGISRRRGRRDALIKVLQKAQLLPKKINEEVLNVIGKRFVARFEGNLKLSDDKNKRPAKENDQEQDSDPARGSYPLLMRVFGLDHPLEPYEFGCVLLQLQKRRGYKSNHDAKYDALYAKLFEETGEDRSKNEIDEKKEIAEAKSKKEKKEARAVLGGIRELKKQKQKAGADTLGEFIYKQAQEEEGPMKRITQYSLTGKKGDKEIYYGDRQLYREEFDALWKKQAAKLRLKDKDKETIENLIFYQRPLLYPVPKKIKKIKKIMIYHKPIDAWSVGSLHHLRYNDVGACSILPHKQRAATALLACQEYRTWQFINNIKIETGGTKQDLTQEQKQKIHALANDAKEVNKNHTLSIRKIKAALGQEINYDSKNNSEEDSVSQLIGNKTAFRIIKVVGLDRWQELGAQNKQDALVNDLLGIGDKVKLYRKLKDEWGFSGGWDGKAYRLAILGLERGHMKHCHEVVQNILEHMRDQGKNYKDACNDLKYQIQASSQGKKSSAEKRKIYIPSVANPRVQKALFEVGRLLSAIIDEYGKPKVIRIELMRELKLSKKDRDNLIKQQRKNRSENEEAKKILQEKGMHEPSPDAIRKYRMLKQQKFKCMYCFDCLEWNPSQDHIEEDHILPLRLFYQNYMNTVLVCKKCNQDKRSKTPHEAWRDDKEKWENIKTRLALDNQRKECLEYPEMPVSKIKRILIEDFDRGKETGFVENQLRDSSYIAKLTKEILESSLKIKIQTTKGRATGMLRNLWELKDLLPNLPDQDKETGKNRRDHRHHAIDAFIVAMTDHKTLLNLTKFKQKDRELSWRHNKKTAEECMKHKQKILKPARWTTGKSIREDVKALIMKAVVSHQQQQNEIYGALHKETCYAKSCYYSSKKIDTRKHTLTNLEKYLKTKPDADGKVIWIARKQERIAIKQWLEEIFKVTIDQDSEENNTIEELLKKMDKPSKQKMKNSLPLDINGKELNEIVLAHRCYVVRKELKEVIQYARKSGEPDKEKTWIMDRAVHQRLADWLREHKEEKLESNPPQMKSGGNLIKSVRIAKRLSEESLREIRKREVMKKKKGLILIRGEIFELGSNHHVELFERIDEKTKKREVKARFISMLEAAERYSNNKRINKLKRDLEKAKRDENNKLINQLNQKLKGIKQRPIVNKEPSRDWDGDRWKFWMSLKKNDMVRWDERDKDAKKHLHLGPPIYRVQKMSGTKNSFDMQFRHYSTTYTDDKEKHGRIRKRKPSDLNCDKISVDVLGSHQE